MALFAGSPELLAGRPAQLAAHTPLQSRLAGRRVVRSAVIDTRQLLCGSGSGSKHSSHDSHLHRPARRTDSFSCRTATPSSTPAVETGGPGSGNGAGGRGFGDGEGAGEGEGDDEERLLGLEEAERIAASSGVKLPKEFIVAATTGGLRLGALQSYIKLQGVAFLGWLSRVLPAARQRLMADPRYLFIVMSEVLIDSGCATVAEVRKRGPDFWDEFEFYLSDLVVGCVLDVVLVSLMAPVAPLSRSKAAQPSALKRALGKVPSAVFEPSTSRLAYGPGSRVACLGVKFLEYSLAGMLCGFVGQAIANQLMRVKRQYSTGEGRQLDIPPLGMTALTWGLFMGVSSNIRYQAVFGLERLVDKTLARKVPQVAYLTSFLLRFLNNVYGGENFIDLARWTGIQ